MQRIVAGGWLIGGILACLGMAGCGPQQQMPMGGMMKGTPEVFVRAPVQREITDYEEFPGRLESDQTIQVRARVTGYLLRYNFKEGGYVNKGDVLFEIDPQLYEAELALAEGNVLEAQGQHEQAKADWLRIQKLRSGETTSEEERNKFRGAYVMAEGKLKAAKAALKKAQVNMAYTKVLAPIAGKISKSAVDPGNLVKADDTVLTGIGSMNPIKATFDVDERTLVRILRLMYEGVVSKDPTGTPVQMWLADESDSDKPQVGKIDFTDNYVDATTGTLRVRGAFPNSDDLLVPGMFVRVRLPIGQAQKALLIEEKALVTDQGQKFVYVVKDENTAEHEGKVEYRQVKLGRLHEGLRVVKEGLAPGEKVVVSGLQRIRPDIKVKFKEAETPPSTVGGNAPDPTKARRPAEGVSKTPQTNAVVAPSGHEKGHGKKSGKGR